MTDTKALAVTHGYDTQARQQPGAIQASGGVTLAMPLEFSAEQRQLIRDTYANGANDNEFAVLMEIARARRLNPFLRQIFFVRRYDLDKQREVWAVQVSIDGLRAIAERTGRYGGQDEPEYIYSPEGHLVLCKVRIYRNDWQRPVVGLAHFDEYAQRKKSGDLTRMWFDKPHVMLGKCAEAQGLRRAFPEDMSALYIPEEMSEDEPPPVRQPPASIAAKVTEQKPAQTTQARPTEQRAPTETKPTPGPRTDGSNSARNTPTSGPRADEAAKDAKPAGHHTDETLAGHGDSYEDPLPSDGATTQVAPEDEMLPFPKGEYHGRTLSSLSGDELIRLVDSFRRMKEKREKENNTEKARECESWVQKLLTWATYRGAKVV